MTRDAGEQPEATAVPRAISALLTALDRDSTAAARRHRGAGRAARLHHFLAFPLHFVSAYLTQRPRRPGVLAFTLAVLRAYGTFMTWAKVWEAEHWVATEHPDGGRATGGAEAIPLDDDGARPPNARAG